MQKEFQETLLRKSRFFMIFIAKNGKQFETQLTQKKS
jgi:hypothetical protein